LGIPLENKTRRREAVYDLLWELSWCGKDCFEDVD
jgi:hypothetical protein